LVVLGRYRAGGPTTIRLHGQINGRDQTFVYAGQAFATSGGDAFLPRLWATRKIGYLLNQIRLNGENPEHVQAIVDLSVRFGVVTPYTSYLITEDDIFTEEGRREVAANAGNGVVVSDTNGFDTTVADAAGPDVASAGNGGVATANADGGLSSIGSEQSRAIDEAQAIGQIAEAEVAAAEPVARDDGVAVVRYVGARTFVQKEGVWIETTFDPTTMTPIMVTFGSDDYFQLLLDHPDLAEAFALGERVIAVSGGQAYEVTP
jgi:Ca-activated chloride channel family protein